MLWSAPLMVTAELVGELLKSAEAFIRDGKLEIATNIPVPIALVENILNNRLLGWPSIATIVSITSATNS